jgi:hypothetical protein
MLVDDHGAEDHGAEGHGVGEPPAQGGGRTGKIPLDAA